MGSGGGWVLFQALDMQEKNNWLKRFGMISVSRPFNTF